ncbi:conserved hypothetical protein [Tenacibaculum sp. 190524A02b]|uniref:Uncharacterized protein n=2 Tax=Tenacibaculum vairaonense TaxID=3137860 RepID=A0ABM9PIP4_9FLAO
MRQKDEHQNPIPFDIEWRTFNGQNKMGGKLIVAHGAILCMKSTKKKDIIKTLKTAPIDKERKNPNHWKHKTRNIELANGEVKKVHFILIIKFNGLTVVP